MPCPRTHSTRLPHLGRNKLTTGISLLSRHQIIRYFALNHRFQVRLLQLPDRCCGCPLSQRHQTRLHQRRLAQDPTGAAAAAPRHRITAQAPCSQCELSRCRDTLPPAVSDAQLRERGRASCRRHRVYIPQQPGPHRCSRVPRACVTQPPFLRMYLKHVFG